VDNDAWNVTTLREHLDRILADLDKRLDQRFDSQDKASEAARVSAKDAVGAAFLAAEKAVTVSQAEALRAREAANEWREAMTDRERRFALQEPTNTRIDSLNQRVAAVELAQNQATGKTSGISSTEGRIVTAIMVVLAVITIVSLIMSFTR
jgi:hypothetical protein